MRNIDNLEIEKYISPLEIVISGTRNICTMISNVELTSTNIVIAGISISVVTIILSPLIYKWYSKKREIVLNNNIETLIEKKESLNPSKLDLLENSVFKDLAERMAILENQRAIEISLSNNSNRILAEQMAILVDQRAIEISISNSSNRTLEKEAVYTISDNNEEISENTEVSEEAIEISISNSSNRTLEKEAVYTISDNNEEIYSLISEPLLFNELPCLNNSSMEELLKELISNEKTQALLTEQEMKKDIEAFLKPLTSKEKREACYKVHSENFFEEREFLNYLKESETQYEYFLKTLINSIYETIKAKQCCETYKKFSLNIESNMQKQNFSTEEIRKTSKLIKDFFTMELDEQKFRLKINELSFEYWYLQYIKNKQVFNMSEDEAAEKATESWKEYYQNLSNSEEIILSFKKMKMIDNFSSDFENWLYVLNLIKSVKYVIYNTRIQNYPCTETVLNLTYQIETFQEKVDLLVTVMDNSNLDSETQIQLNINELEEMESISFPENAKALFYASKRVVEFLVELASDHAVFN